MRRHTQAHRFQRALEISDVPLPIAVRRGECMSRCEVAILLGMSREAVRLIEERALRKLKGRVWFYGERS